MSNRYEVFDPFAELPDATSGEERSLARLGWEEFLSIGEEDSWMRLLSWQRTLPDGTVEYMVEVSDVVQGSPWVKVDSFPDLMDLFARWAPAVQAASVVHLIDELRDGRLDTYGTVEQIAARVAYGITDVLPEMRQQKRAEQRHQIRQREARRAAAQSPAEPG